MKKLKILSMLLIIVIFSTVISPVVNAATSNCVDVTVVGCRNYDYALAVFNYTNLARKNNGLSTLSYDKVLTEAAMKRAEEIALNFAHTRANGEKWSTVSNKANGENIALGQETPEEVVYGEYGWMNSTGHRANILRTTFKSIGVGCFILDDTIYWVQLFGTKAATEAPSKTGITEEYEAVVEVSKANIRAICAEFSKYNMTVKAGETIRTTQVYMQNCDSDGNMGIEDDDDFGFVPISMNNVTFTSSNINVASVDENGVIYGRSEGEANITIEIGGCRKTYTVKVLKNEALEQKPSVNPLDEPREEPVEDPADPTDTPEEPVEEEPIQIEVITDEFGTYILGDLDGDNIINAADAAMILDIFKNGNATLEQIRRADIDRNGVVNAIDAAKALDLFKASGAKK